MDIKGFKRDCSKKQAELELVHSSGYVYITSLDNREKQTRAGTVVEVSLQNAARHLVERSATVSTPEEIEGYQQRAEETRQTIIAAGRRFVEKELRISVDR
jgi:hypothetical protein